MTLEEIEQATAEAKSRAEGLAAPIIARGTAAGASELDRVKAEYANLVLENAAGAAATFPADAVASMRADLEAFAADVEKRAAAATAAGEEVTELLGHAHAVLDRKNDATKAVLANHALAAWKVACDKLAEVCKDG